MSTSVHYHIISILAVLFGSVSFLFANTKDSIKSYTLEEIVITDDFSKPINENDRFTNGNILKANPKLLNDLQHTSLSDFLAQNTSIFIKESGHGMLSSISMRGTSSSHTQVTWNDIPINPLTMGQVDFSQLPLFFFDQITVYEGGESSIHGNGAIGGAISLRSIPSFDKKFSLSLQETLGSYQNTFSGLKLNAGNNKIQSKTALFYNQSKNNFSFNFRGEEFRQKNSAFHNYGFLEELNFKLTNNQYLSAKLWHTYYFRDIQPMMQNNNDSSKYESIDNRASRAILDYAYYAPFIFKMKLGWLNDHQEYLSDIIATNNILGKVSVERTWRNIFIPQINFKAGSDVQYIRPEVSAYKDDVTEWRSSFFLLTAFKVLPRVDITAHLRQDYVTDIDVPFSPSGGINIDLIKNDKHNWKISGSASKSFKVPTLNDRYWGDLDNRNLQPEDGVNLEGSSYYTFLGKNKTEVHLIYYHNDVSNWIMWMPRGNIWKPMNIDRVLAQGFEGGFSQSLLLGKTKHTFNFNYAYNHTEVMKGFNEMKPFVGQQIPLLPEHTFSSYLIGQIKKFSYSLQSSYTGKRTTSDIYEIMDAYFLLNINVGYDFHLRPSKSQKYKNIISISTQLNNILNTDYQNMPYKAMPCINGSVTVKWRMEKLYNN